VGVCILWDLSPKGLFSLGQDPQGDGKVEAKPVKGDGHYKNEEALTGSVLDSGMFVD
jgi:hypothetical protein